MSYTVADPIYFLKPTFRFRRPMGTNKNLFEHFNEEDSLTPSEDAIKVFLRLKPTKTESNVIQVLDSQTLLFKMPQEFMQARNKLNMPDQYKYSFSHIYEADATQSQIYTGCVAPLIKDLFNGQHCLLFTYGTTNAGKTFTVLGKGDNPGIIPRTLITVFRSISGKEFNNDKIMPERFNSAVEISESTHAEERKFKDRILTWKPSQLDSKLYKTSSTACSSIDDIFGESVFSEMQKRLTNDPSIIECSSDSDERYSVWVSFAEIYNEAIYDLLQPVIPNSKRKQLKLGQDDHKNYYIKGLKHVFVQSEEEAYKVLMFGKTNLQVAATGMNSSSSRSHCIFTIKLIKSPNEPHPKQVVVSSFSICDLAGAERQKKTLNVGLRLKESQNINCSLHVLSRCFNIIRENQQCTEPKMIPFRDSKLTQLFKHALTGKENVTMIVNVNTEHKLCEETQHVLKASAIAKHIVVQPRKARLPKRDTRQSMFSQIVKHNRSTLIPWDSCVKNKALGQVDEVPAIDELNLNDREQKQDQCENLLILVEELKEKLKKEKAKHSETKKNWIIKEDAIREEMKEELARLLEINRQQDKSDCNRIEEVIKEVTKPKKRRLLSPKEEPVEPMGDQSIELKDLQEEVRMQQRQIDGLTDLVNSLREEKKELSMELNLARFNLSFKEREVNNLKAKIEMFGEESALHEKYLQLEKEMEDKLKIRDELLNEAKVDFLAELNAKEDLEEEIAKQEKEFAEKEEELLSKIEEMKQEINDKEDEIELLGAKIENYSYMHADEVKSLKNKITLLEEEIACLKEQGADSESIIPLQKQISSLTMEKEGLLCEKLSVEEQLRIQSEKFALFKMETTKKLESVQILQENISEVKHDYEQKLRECDEEIKRLKEEKSVQFLTLQELENKLQTKIDELNLNRATLEEKEKEFNSEKAKFKNMISKLTLRLDEGNELSEINSELKYKCQILQEELDKRLEEIDSLQKSVESVTVDKQKMEEEYRSEISTLEKSHKSQLQETTRLWETQRSQGVEKEKLSKELSRVKNIVADLNNSLKAKEHELECCRSEMSGYKKMVPALQSEFDLQRRELQEYKQRCDDQKETIINMEKELDSFHANQKEIIGKYEDTLKKANNENEALKKEVARVTSTFYKSTPTPQKNLQKQLDEKNVLIEDLRKKLKELAFSDQMKNKTLDIDHNARRRAKSCVDDDYSSCDVDKENISKSSSKAGARRTRRAAVLASTSSIAAAIDGASGIKDAEPKKQTRKKLYNCTLNDNNEDKEIGEDDEQLAIPEDSPGTFYRRTLRNRKK